MDTLFTSLSLNPVKKETRYALRQMYSFLPDSFRVNVLRKTTSYVDFIIIPKMGSIRRYKGRASKQSISWTTIPPYLNMYVESI